MAILETSRLLLREFVSGDVDALSRVFSDAETMRFYPKTFDRAAVEAWIARNLQRYEKDSHGMWAMILKSSSELIGDCGLTVQTIDNAEEVEVGYHVRRDLWRHGLATEAARACRDWGFARLKIERLISIIRPENQASCRVAEKNGMTIWKNAIYANLPHRVYAIRGERWRESAGEKSLQSS